jgi:hypothetical protein
VQPCMRMIHLSICEGSEHGGEAGSVQHIPFPPGADPVMIIKSAIS